MNYLLYAFKYIYNLVIEISRGGKKAIIFDDYRIYVAFKNGTWGYIYKSQVENFGYFNLSDEEASETYYLSFIENMFEFLDFLKFIKAHADDILFNAPEVILKFINMARILRLNYHCGKLFTTNVVRWIKGTGNTLINSNMIYLLHLDDEKMLYFLNSILFHYKHVFLFEKNTEGYDAILTDIKHLKDKEWKYPEVIRASSLRIYLDLNTILHKRNALLDIVELVAVFLVIYQIEYFAFENNEAKGLTTILETKIKKMVDLIKKLSE